MLTKARFILSKSKAIEQYNIAKGLSGIVAYSSKTNYEVSKVLEENTDSLFLVHTIGSLEKIKDMSRVWYHPQALDPEEMGMVLGKGIRRFIVDNKGDLEVVMKSIGDIKIDLLLRMRLKEHTVHTGKHFVFGMFSREINELIPELRDNKNIDKLGVHFHRKTQNISEWTLKYELEKALTDETLKCIDYVDIGGGIPSRYKNFRKEVLDNIFEEITTLRNWIHGNDIKMIIEPGRFISAPSVKLETTIKNIYNNTIVVDASVFNSDTDAFVSNLRLLVEGEGAGESYTIKGCTPDSIDIFRYDVKLKNPKIGDKIVFLNAGAYNFRTDFCLLPKLETVIVD